MEPSELDIRLFAKCKEGDGIAFKVGSQLITVGQDGKMLKRKFNPPKSERNWRIVPSRALSDPFEIEAGRTYAIRNAICKCIKRIKYKCAFLVLAVDTVTVFFIGSAELQRYMDEGDVWLLSVK